MAGNETVDCVIEMLLGVPKLGDKHADTPAPVIHTPLLSSIQDQLR